MPEDDFDWDEAKRWHTLNLKLTLRQLAAPVDDLKTLYPRGACAGSELLSDLDSWSKGSFSLGGSSSAEREAIDRLWEVIGSLYQEGIDEDGCECDFFTRSLWRDVQARAHEALQVFRWAFGIPTYDEIMHPNQNAPGAGDDGWWRDF